MIVTFILWAFGSAFVAAFVGIPAQFTDPIFIVGGLLGVLLRVAAKREQMREQVACEARKQERQARLIADATTERQIRQALGEYQ